MRTDIIIKELQFKAVRSSGPGGQHVNTTASKVEISFDVFASEGLSQTEKDRLGTKLSNRLSTAGLLTLHSSDSRSQHRNKKLGIERMLQLLTQSLKVSKARKKTKPSKGAIEKRLQSKKKQALKKSNRKPPTAE